MRCLLALVLALLLVLGPLPVAAKDTSIDNVQPLQMNGETFCTAFSIGRTHHYWATARHCIEYAIEAAGDGRIISLAGYRISVVYVDQYRDVAIVWSPLKADHPIALATHVPVVGQDAEMRGFPYGVKGVVLAKGMFAAAGIPIEGYHDSDIYIMVVGGGNSGSPVTINGRLVGICWGSFSTPHMLAVPYADVIRILTPFTR